MRYICLTVMSCFDLTPSQNQPPPIHKIGMNSKQKQKTKLKFWPVGNFKAPIRFAFMKIFSFAQREIRFGLRNFIMQALRLCQVLFVIVICLLKFQKIRKLLNFRKANQSTENSGNFGMKIRWNGNFQENMFENLGIPHEVVLFFGNYANLQFSIQR